MEIITNAAECLLRAGVIPSRFYVQIHLLTLEKRLLLSSSFYI